LPGWSRPAGIACSRRCSGQTQRPLLFKLFGDAAQASSFALTHSDLQNRLRSNEALSKFLNTLWVGNSFFFVGFSLEALSELLRTLSLQSSGVRHVGLVPRSGWFELEAERLRARYGVVLVPFSPGGELAAAQEAFAYVKESASGPGTRLPEGAISSITSLRLERIGPFEELELEFERGWNVLLGNNGCGKSTILRAIALGLCGDAPQAVEAGGQLLRVGASQGSIEIRAGHASYRTELVRHDDGVYVKSPQITPLQTGKWVVLGFPPVRGVFLNVPRGPSRDGLTKPDVSDLLPLLKGVVDPRVDGIRQWLVNLDVRSKTAKHTEERSKASGIRAAFFGLLNEMTPGAHCAFSHVDEKTWQVWVSTPDGVVPIERLSQGASSLLGWVGSLVQRLYEIYGSSSAPQLQPAVVLVDEVDAHLHPEWQQLVVPLVRKLLPGIQVIATTHSPLIVGNLKQGEFQHIYRREDEVPEVQKIDTSFVGWRADQILTSPAFRLETTRSAEANERLNVYASLQGKKERTPHEEQHLKQLEAWLREDVPSSAESPYRREAEQLLSQAFAQRLNDKPRDEREKLLEEAGKLLAQMDSGEEQTDAPR
jgi:energy-coupling factor transporter ATP-binding protein EcfA2